MSSGTIIFTADTKDFRVSDADFIRAEKEKFEYFTQIEVSFPSPSKKVTLELFLVDFTKITNSIGETEQRTVDYSERKWISPTETKAIFLVSNKDLENRTYIDAVFWDEGGVEFTEIEFGPSLQLANISYTQLLFPTANNVEAFRLDRHEKAAHIRLSNLVKNKNYTIDIRFTKEDGNPENEYLTINDVPSNSMDINLGNVEHLKAQTVMELEQDSWYSIKEKTNLQDFIKFGAAVQIVTKADMKIDAAATLAYTSADGTVALHGITAAEVKIAFPVGSSVLFLNGKKLEVVAHVAAGILCEIGGVDEGANVDFQREYINPFKSLSSGQLASGNTCWFLGADRILPRHDLMNGENVRISISEIIHSKDQDGAPTVMTGESTVIYLPGASDNAERVHVNLNMLSQETEYDVKIKLKNTTVSKHVDEENYNTFRENLAYQIFAVKNDDAAVAKMVSKTIKGKLDGEIFSLLPGNPNSNYCIKPGRKLAAEVNSISYVKANNFTDDDLIDFGNNDSSLVDDPDTNYPNKKVFKIVKGNENWSGTTINNGYRYILTENDTKITVRVWSPEIGVPVRLKLEDSNDPTHSVETNSDTTKKDKWETLTFDFNTQAQGTAALNLSYVFDKLSIFMDFGNNQPGGVYYFDDVMFLETWLSVSDLDVAYSAGTIISQSGNGNGIGRLVNDVAIGDTSLRIVVESGAFDVTNDLSMNILVNDNVQVTSVSTNSNICTMVVPTLANAYAKQMLVTQPSGNGFGRLVNNVAAGDNKSLQIVVESGTFEAGKSLSVYDNFTWSDEGQWTRLQNFYTRSQLDENDILSFTQNMIESVSVTNVSTTSNTCTMSVSAPLTKAYSVAGTVVTQPSGSGNGIGTLLNAVAMGDTSLKITVTSGTFDTSNVNMIDTSYKYSISSNLTGVLETNFVDQNKNWASSKQDYVSQDNNVIVMTPTPVLTKAYSKGTPVTQGSGSGSGKGTLLNDVAIGDTSLHIVVDSDSGTFDGTNDLSISSENVQVTSKHEYIKITGDLSYTHNLVLKSFINSIDLKHDGKFTINLDNSFAIKFESDKQRSTVEFTRRNRNGNGTSFMVDAIYESDYKLTGTAGAGMLLKGNQYEVNVVVDEKPLPAFEPNSDIQSYRPVRNNFIKLDETLVNSFRTTTSSSSLTNKNMTVHIDQQLGEIDESLVTTNYKLTRQTNDTIINVSLAQQHLVVLALDNAYSAGTVVTQPLGSGSGTLVKAVAAGDTSLEITVTSGTFDGTNDLSISGDSVQVTSNNKCTMLVPALTKAYPAGTVVTQLGSGSGTLLKAVEAGDKSLQIVVTSGTFDGTNDLIISELYEKSAITLTPAYTMVVPALANAYSAGTAVTQPSGSGKGIGTLLNAVEAGDTSLQIVVTSGTFDGTNDLSISDDPVKVTSVSSDTSTFIVEPLNAWENYEIFVETQVDNHWSDKGGMGNNIDIDVEYKRKDNEFLGFIEVNSSTIHQTNDRESVEVTSVSTIGSTCTMSVPAALDNEYSAGTLVTQPLGSGIGRLVKNVAIGDTSFQIVVESGTFDGNSKVEILGTYINTEIKRHPRSEKNIGTPLKTFHGGKGVFTLFLDDIDDPNNNKSTIGAPVSDNIKHPISGGGNAVIKLRLEYESSQGEKVVSDVIPSYPILDIRSNLFKLNQIQLNDNYYQPDIMNCVLDSSLNSNINRYYDVSFSATVSTATTTLLLNTPTATTTLLLNTPTTATESFGVTVTQTGTGAVGTLGIALDGTSTSSIVIVMDNGSAAFDSLNDLSINVTVIASGNISSVSNYLKTFSDSEPSGQLDYSNKLGGEGVRTTFTPTFVSNQLMQHAVPTMIPVCHKTHTVPTAVTIANDTTERQIEIGNTIKVTDTRSFTPDNTTNNNNHSFSVFHEKLYGNAVTANVRKSSINTNNFDLILDNQVGQRNQFSAKTSVTSASTASNICTMSVPALIRSYPAGTVVTQPSGSGNGSGTLFNAVAMGDKSLQITVTSGAFDATNDLIMEQYIGAQVTTARVDTTCNPSSDDLSTAVFKSKSNIINTFWDLDFTTYENDKFRLGHPPIVTNEKAVAQYKIGPYTHKTTRAERRCKLAVNGQSEVPIDSHIYVCTMVVPKLTKAYSAGTLVTQGSGSGKGSGTLLNAVAIDDTSLEIVVDSGTFDGTNDLSIFDNVQVTSVSTAGNTCTMGVPKLTKAYSAGTLVTQPSGSGKGSGKLLNAVAVGEKTLQITVESGTFDVTNDLSISGDPVKVTSALLELNTKVFVSDNHFVENPNETPGNSTLLTLDNFAKSIIMNFNYADASALTADVQKERSMRSITNSEVLVDTSETTVGSITSEVDFDPTLTFKIRRSATLSNTNFEISGVVQDGVITTDLVSSLITDNIVVQYDNNNNNKIVTSGKIGAYTNNTKKLSLTNIVGTFDVGKKVYMLNEKDNDTGYQLEVTTLPGYSSKDNEYTMYFFNLDNNANNSQFDFEWEQKSTSFRPQDKPSNVKASILEYDVSSTRGELNLFFLFSSKDSGFNVNLFDVVLSQVTYEYKTLNSNQEMSRD